VKVTLWGTRGSLAAPGPETTRYGGNTSCVEVRGDDGAVLVLDAGTGIRRLGAALPSPLQRVDLLLTHLHMDHLQGLGFFAPLYNPAIEFHIWGPASTTLTLRERLTRYLSPPLFPTRLRDLPAPPILHEVPCQPFQIGEFHISCDLVCHPGPTVGYRIAGPQAVLTYLPDHEPALGVSTFPLAAEWTSGYALAADADLLIHDAQYSAEEYQTRVGWGHSRVEHAIAFATLARVKQLVPFHHEPAHTDADLDRLFDAAIATTRPPFPLVRGKEGDVIDLGTVSASGRRKAGRAI
jgi:phosphoribosyl 1,2-cyclic phosphodiesterase